ncbi:hypothetical protein KAS31_00175, partial [Candidatus Parcubacteria bacterium]|nr:hypothetical protein [Candidatus Parcubacteria bacterium]
IASDYTAAAIISLLPGTVEENVQILDEMIDQIKKDGFFRNNYSAIVNKAVTVIAGGLREMFKQENKRSLFSGSLARNAGDSCDFGIINGRYMRDDGITGGLTGGLFDF